MAVSNDPQVRSNWKATFDSSNFGTRKLAFYMVNLPHSHGMAENWEEPNSLYFQIVQMLQQRGAEIYWLGYPQYADTLGYDDCFTFAMADDADSPRQVQVDGGTITATATDSVTNEITVDSTDYVYEYNTYVTFSAPTIGGLVAGRKYYIAQTNEGNPGTITLSNEPNGTIVQLTTATGSMTGTTVIYDTEWTGTAGDIQFGCCGGPGGGDGAYQCITATNFIYGDGQNLWDITDNSDGWIERLVPTNSIAPRWVADLNG
jgi:hypothetical protein